MKIDRERDEVRVAAGSLDDRDDGYITPDFGLSSEDDGEGHVALPLPPPKRAKSSSSRRAAEPGDFEGEEEMALQLLRRK